MTQLSWHKRDCYEPFQHTVVDGYFQDRDIQLVDEQWTPADSKDWFHYRDPWQTKQVIWNWDYLPPACREMLGAMMALPMQALMMMDNLVPDGTLYGAGMNTLVRGGSLARHQDHDRHPVLGRRRMCNATLFCNQEWQSEWKGQFEMWGAGDKPVQIEPRFNRLVLFDARWGVHGINGPLECPDDVMRKTLTVFFYGPELPEEDSVRPRAHFLDIEQGG